MTGVLAGKRTLLIGGGGEGNGAQIRQALVAAGSSVAVADIDPLRVEAAVKDVTTAGGQAVGITADMRSGADIDRMVTNAAEQLGGIDVLVTVVGGYGLLAPWAPVHETTDDDWEKVVDLNLRYVFRTVRATIKVFLAQAQGGTIVSIGSVAGVVSSPMSCAYGAAKAGLVNFARTVSVEYARDGIRMNVLSLGLVRTPASMMNDLGPMEERIPCGRAGTTEEIANTVVFLASEQSSYISGQNLNIDGAATAHFPLILPKAKPYMAG